jgi:septal ring factor EnvC (AmiA/AmiB activator)
MLIRISLIVAIVAALAAAALNFTVVKGKIDALTQDRNTQRDQKVQAQTELASTKKELAKTKDDLAQTQQELTDTQKERDKAVADAATQSKRADDLSDKLAKTTQERDDARNNLAAYTTTGFTAEQVTKLGKSLKDAQTEIEAISEEKMVLQHAVLTLKTRLAKYEGPDTNIKLRADLKGKILVVDPKWDFVVLNIGEDQGVIEDGQLLVSRDGKLVAKVIVRSVEKDRCIANIMPGWELGQVIEGDEVTPAYPAS